MSVTIEPFQLSHLLTIMHDTPERVTWRMIKEEHLHGLANGHAITGLVDGQVAACGGLLPIWDGVAEGWLASTPLANAHGFTLTRNVVRFFRAKARELNLHRVQAHVDATFGAAWYWLERMGFERESTLRRYGPKQQDYYLYVWYPA